MTENAERETERKGFTFFRSYYDAAEDMTDEEMLSYLKAIIHYSLFGEEPEELPRLVKAVFAAIKPNLDGNAKQFKNGCSGGRPRKTKNETGFENEKPNSEWVSEEENLGFTNEKPYKDKDMDMDMDMDKELYAPGDNVVICLPLNDGKEYPVEQALVTEFQNAYPGVDIMQELRSMRMWLLTNENKRKTRKGIKKFMNNWLGKKQDNCGKYHQTSQNEAPKDRILCYTGETL